MRSLLVLAAVLAVAAAPAKPNLVVVLSDDHGYLDSTVYGAADVRTPNLEKLAKEGMTLTGMFVASPACAPSRSAMLTGLMPARNGAERNHTFKRDGVASLTENVKALGYEVAAFGKVAHGNDVVRHGFDVQARPASVKVVGDFLAGRKADRPLCLFVGTPEPHVPWPDLDGYEPDKVRLPPTHVDTAETRDFRCRYYTDVTKADAFVGDMLALARKHLDAKNTLVVYTSDHGAQWPFGKWNLYDAGIRVPFLAAWPSVIAPGSKSDALCSWVDLLPTLIDAAGGTPPKDIDGKSFLPVLKGEAKGHREAIFATHSGDGEMNVYPIRCVRTAGWKYVRNLHPEFVHGTHIDRAMDADGVKYFRSWEEKAKTDPAAAALVKRYRERPREELYDLAADPYETTNLAADAKQAERLTGLRKQLDDWMKAQLDKETVFGTPRRITGEAPKPNVIVVLADDFGYGDVGCYGGTLVPTPQLDKMAREGVRFTQAYVASPICSPSRCGLLTGQFPGRWRITSFLQTRAGNKACEMADFLDAKAPSLPALLKTAGYATAHVGKWHLGGGRDVADAPKFAAYGYDLGVGTWESPEPHPDITAKNWIWSDDDKVKRWDRTAWMIDRTLDFLKANGDKPCFVNLWLDDTHTPWVPSAEDQARMTPNSQAMYKKVTAEMDRQLGRMLDALRKSDRPTLVLFLGDNGPLPTFDQKRTAGLRGSKLSLYEGGVRVPFLAWGPGLVKPGLVNDATVLSSLDVLPSVCHLAGVAPPKDGDGEDLSAALLGQATPKRTRPLFWEYGRNDTAFAYPRDAKHRSPNVAVRDGNWKLLVHAGGTKAELYDLADDPNETKDRAADQPDVAKRLTEAALKWRRSLP